MSFIKFPTEINPSRVTVELARTDELFISPSTGVQQVASRGNAFWKWTYEFADISESERDIVQSFLTKCQGSLNTFKVGDPGQYELKGGLSSGWSDMLSGRGSFVADVGSGFSKLNSYFLKGGGFIGHVTDDRHVIMEWLVRTSANGVSPLSISGNPSEVDSLHPGKAYIQRIKHFQSDERLSHITSFRVGSGAAGSYLLQSGPGQTTVGSTDVMTAPFYLPSSIDGIQLSIVDWQAGASTADFSGAQWKYADYRIARCALVANSENLLTRSNEFDHADWVDNFANVDSGYGRSPTGINSGAWKLYEDSTNNIHVIIQDVTKPTTEDLYTYSMYAKASEKPRIRLRLDDDADTANFILGDFDLSVASATNLQVGGAYVRPKAEIFDVGSGWLRCSVSAVVSSLNLMRALTYIFSGTSLTYTGNGSDGVEIYGAQLQKFPFMGKYTPTITDTVVGTASQIGKYLNIDGLDPRSIIKAGTRMEVINRYHDRTAGTYERSEFKRVVNEVFVSEEGYARIQVEPPMRNVPTPSRSYRQQSHLGETQHNAVIFADPEMKGRLLQSSVQYVDKPLRMTDVVFEVIEDLTE